MTPVRWISVATFIWNLTFMAWHLSEGRVLAASVHAIFVVGAVVLFIRGGDHLDWDYEPSEEIGDDQT